MRLAKLRGRLRYANVVATLALVVAVVGGGSAIAEPVAQGAASLTAKLTEALNLGKQSNQRSKRALRASKSARQTADRALAASGNAYTKAESNGRFLATNGKAANAALLGGLDSAAFLGATARAADSDELDGLDSTEFARTGQSATTGFRLIDQNTYDCVDVDGPAVTVEVGPSGLVAIYAEATMSAGSTDPGREIRMQLYEPTALPGCETILRRTDIASGMRRTSPGTDAGTAARGSWLLYRVPPGERTFSLRAGHTGNGIGIFAFAEERYLYAQPL
jgi:hypothetical protein